MWIEIRDRILKTARLLREFVEQCSLNRHRYTHYPRLLLAIAIVIVALDWVGKLTALQFVLGAFWRAIASLGPWVLLPSAFVMWVWLKYPNLRKRLSLPAFECRPISGDTLGASPGDDVTAKLAIKSSAWQERCTVRLLNAGLIHNGYLLAGPNWKPSISAARGESFLLRWSDSEASADPRYLDLAGDGNERTCDLLVLDRDNPKGFARFAAAIPADLKGRLAGIGGNGWWMLKISISSKKGLRQEVKLLAAVSDRDPGPINVQHWEPRGPAMLKETVPAGSAN